MQRVETAEVRRCLERVLSSEMFRRTERQSRFLRYVVEHTLDGRPEALKEYTLALEVFDRDSTYDPKLDSTVRVEASKLRARLDRYYSTEGSGDSVRIDMPKGAYAVRFVASEQPAEPAPAPASGRRFLSRRVLIGRAAAATAVVGGAAALFSVIGNAPDIPALLLTADSADRGGTSPEAEEAALSTANALGLQGIPVLRRAEEVTPANGSMVPFVTIMAGRSWADPGRVQLVAELRDASGFLPVWAGSWNSTRDQATDLGRDAAMEIVSQCRELRRRGAVSESRRRALVVHREARDVLSKYAKDFSLQTTSERASLPAMTVLMDGGRLLNEAVRLDPGYAEAAANLAWVYKLAAEYDESMYEKAQQTAARALQLDPGSPEANYVAGWLAMFRDWNVAEAERLFATSVKRARLHAEAYRLYVDAASIRGHLSKAADTLLVPLSVLPRSPVLRYAAYSLASTERKYEESERIAAEALKWAPRDVRTNYLLARACAEANKPEAEGMLLDVLKRDPKHTNAIYNLARLHARSGRARLSEEILRQNSLERYPSLMGLVAAARGDKSKAVAWFEQADKMRDNNLLYVVLDEHVQALQSEPEIQALFRRFRG